MNGTHKITINLNIKFIINSSNYTVTKNGQNNMNTVNPRIEAGPG